jgi:hypothetical protein
VFYFLDLVQHIDKVNGNSTNLLPRTYLPNGQAVKSSWAEPVASRPGIYQWTEQIWGFECVSETAFVDNNEPVIYRQLQEEGSSGIRSRKNICSDCAIHKEKAGKLDEALHSSKKLYSDDMEKMQKNCSVLQEKLNKSEENVKTYENSLADGRNKRSSMETELFYLRGALAIVGVIGIIGVGFATSKSGSGFRR